MSTMIHLRWRWLCLIGLLVAVGWALYLVLPPQPRWRVPGHAIHGFMDDGRVAVVTTRVKSRVVEAGQRAPLAERTFAWIDVETGSTLRSFDVVSSYHLFSPDYRVLAAGDGNDFWFIDAAKGRKTKAEGKWPYEESTWQAIQFSESGKWLVRKSGKRGEIANVFDTDRGSIRKQWSYSTYRRWFLPATEQLVLSLNERNGRGNDCLVIWDADDDEHLATLGPYRKWLGFTSDGRYVVGAPADDDAWFHVLDLTKRGVILYSSAAYDSHRLKSS